MKRKRDQDSTHPAQLKNRLARPPPPPHRHQRSSSPAVQPSHWTVWHSPSSRWTSLDHSTLPTHSTLSSPPTPSSSPTSLSLSFLTYNTFSSSPSHTPLQSRTLCSLLHESSAHVIALQEVSLPFFRLLSSLPWVRSDYALTTPEAFWAVAGEGGKGPKSKEGAREAVVVLVRKELLGRGSEVAFLKLPRARDEQGKAGIVAKLYSGGREQLRIFTSHFTSLPENASIRSAQYRLAHSILTAGPSTSSASLPHPHLVLLGDFNASSEAEFAPLLAPIPGTIPSLRFVDACPLPPPSSSSSRKRPHPSSSSSEKEQEKRFRHRPTFGHLYPYVSLHSRKPRKPRRIDRVYVSSSSSSEGGGLKVKKYEEVGTDPLRDEQGRYVRDRLGKEGRGWASDHVGVRVEVEVEWEGEGEGEGDGDEVEEEGEEEEEEDAGEEEGKEPVKKKRRRGKKKKRRRRKEEGE